MRTVNLLWDFAERCFRRRPAVIAAGLIAVLAAACVDAQPEIAPDFRVTECFKADSLVLSEFSESPVVLFFFDALDAECFKAYPYVVNWNTKYAADGVRVIGVHCPGYEASKLWPNVLTAVARTEITFPIAFDKERKIYDDFGLERLPTLVLLGPGGRIAARASKEAEYEDLESSIHQVLRAIEPNVVLPFLFERHRASQGQGKFPPPTPKIDLGFRSGRIVGCDSTDIGKFRRYTDPGGKEQGKIYLEGRWKVEDRLLTYEEGEAAYIRVVYSGKDVWLLPYFGFEDGAIVYVVQDRSPLRPEVMGRDMMNDLEAKTFINMRHAVPKHLLSNAAYGTHELRIIPVEGVISFEYLFFEGAD